MANTRLFLDTRAMGKSKNATLKVALAHQKKTAYISLDVKLTVEQWDKTNSCVINHPEKERLNLFITNQRLSIDRIILMLKDQGKINELDVSTIKALIERDLNPEIAEKRQKQEEKQRDKNLFANRFLAFAESKKKSTKSIYMHTYSRMDAFVGHAKLHALAFEDVTKEWLSKFEVFLSQTSPSKNSRNIHLRNIRAVFNEAIDDEITTFYPFRRYKIRPVATRKRNLKVDDLRMLFNYPCEPHAQKYLDMFKLMFMLIGINAIVPLAV